MFCILRERENIYIYDIIRIHDTKSEKDEQVRIGTLRRDANRLTKGAKFGAVADKLIAYIQLRKELMKKDKVGLSWVVMQAKALDWARAELGAADAAEFSASPGWISNVLRPLPRLLSAAARHCEASCGSTT